MFWWEKAQGPVGTNRKQISLRPMGIRGEFPKEIITELTQEGVIQVKPCKGRGAVFQAEGKAWHRPRLRTPPILMLLLTSNFRQRALSLVGSFILLTICHPLSKPELRAFVSHTLLGGRKRI